MIRSSDDLMIRESVMHFLNTATTTLTQAGIDTAALDARVLLQHVLDVSPEWLVAHAHAPLSEEAQARFSAAISRRARHEPVAYITGYQDFWKDRFAVSPATLIPRPDSETLIEAALTLYAHQPPATLLDLGTGTGCLALSLLREFPSAHALGVDLREDALAVALRNAQALGLDQRITFACGDMADEASLPALPETFDLIISNPPYIPTTQMHTLPASVGGFEPPSALDGGTQGLNYYAACFKWLPKRMHDSSVCLFEVGYDQAEDVALLAKHHMTCTTQTYNDLAGHARVVSITRQAR